MVSNSRAVVTCRAFSSLKRISFKAPSFFENFAEGFTVGNPELQPEVTRSAEVGADASVGGTAVRVTLFTQRFKNLVQYDGAAAFGDPNYFNIAAANAGGMELEVRLPEVRATRLSGSYSWTETKVRRAGFDPGASATFVAGGPLLRRPEHLASLHLTTRLGDAGTIILTATRVGAREDRDFSAFPAAVVELPAHLTVDLATDLALPAAWFAGGRLLLRADNVLGTAYQPIHGFDAPGRTLYAGLKLQR